MARAAQVAPSVSWSTQVSSSNPSHQAYQLLHWGFSAAPLLAGADKFVGLFTDWSQYLAPQIAALSPLSSHATLRAVGVVEMAAGLLVALRPKLGAYVVAGWLFAVIVNLLLLGRFYDIALRDFGLALAALALARLSAAPPAREQAERGEAP